MLKIILKRILQLIPVLLITMSITFVITRVLPGNPAVTILGPQATPEAIEKMEEEMELNDPLPIQYINYIKGVLTGDLGYILPVQSAGCHLDFGKAAEYFTVGFGQFDHSAGHRYSRGVAVCGEAIFRI